MFTEFFLYPSSPVLVLLLTATALIGLECLPLDHWSRGKFCVAIGGAVASILLSVLLWKAWPIPYSSVGYSGAEAWLAEFYRSYFLDRQVLAFFLGIGLFTFLSLVFMNFHFQEHELRAEVFILVLFVASGMMLLVSANSLLMIFLALEFLSLPTYILVGIQKRDKASGEAALKYFLFGSFASVLLVFGIAFLYGRYGTLNIPDILNAIQTMSVDSPTPKRLTLAALGLLLVGVGFKIGLVPFHMWIPDTYQGAPSPVTGFMGSAVKLAGFGLVLRLFWGMFLPLIDQWGPIFDTLAIATMFVGNIAALVQDNLKRMFAYSSISHAGYLLLGVTSLSPENGSLLYYYLLIYGLMYLGLFAIIAFIEYYTKNTEIYQISGMGFTHPFLGLYLALFAISGAGIPPTAGFLAKYFIFLEAVKAQKTFLVVLAVLSSLIGVYYYLRVVVYLYMKESKERIALPVSHRFAFFCIFLCALSQVYFAFSPSLLGFGKW